MEDYVINDRNIEFSDQVLNVLHFQRGIGQINRCLLLRPDRFLPKLPKYKLVAFHNIDENKNKVYIFTMEYLTIDFH